MPKVKDFNATLQFLKSKVPQHGMFSTLDELIQAAPMHAAPVKEWENYLKPGRLLQRAGVDFPLKQEEIDYTHLPALLKGISDNNRLKEGMDPARLTREQLADLVSSYREPLVTHISTQDQDMAAAVERMHQLTGQEPEVERAGDLDRYLNSSHREDPMRQGIDRQARFAEYAHQGLNDGSGYDWAPGYEESLTRAPTLGHYSTHFTPDTISHSRSTSHPLAERPTLEGLPGNPGLARLVEEIQSDRHSAAAERWPKDVTIVPRHSDYELQNREVLAQEYFTRMGHQLSGPYKDLDEADLMKAHLESIAGKRKGYRDMTRIQELEDQMTGPRRNLPHMQTQELDRIKRLPPDAPFKSPSDYGMLELKKQLLDAVNQDASHLAITRGQDQIDRYAQGMGETEQAGMRHIYDNVYPSVLAKLARQYGAKMGTVDVPVRSLKDDRPATLVSHGYEDPERMIEDIMEENLDSTDITPLIREYAERLPADDHRIGQAHDAVARLKAIEDKNSDLEKAGKESDWGDDWQEAVQELSGHLDDLHKAWQHQVAIGGNTGRDVKTFPAMELTPEVKQRVKDAGVPLWTMTGAGAGLAAAGAQQDSPGYAKGGKVENIKGLYGKIYSRWKALQDSMLNDDVTKRPAAQDLDAMRAERDQLVEKLNELRANDEYGDNDYAKGGRIEGLVAALKKMGIDARGRGEKLLDEQPQLGKVLTGTSLNDLVNSRQPSILLPKNRYNNLATHWDYEDDEVPEMVDSIRNIGLRQPPMLALMPHGDNLGVFGHDGRHRAAALSQLGVPTPTALDINPGGRLRGLKGTRADRDLLLDFVKRYSHLDNENKFRGIDNSGFATGDDEFYGAPRTYKIDPDSVFADGGQVPNKMSYLRKITKSMAHAVPGLDDDTADYAGDTLAYAPTGFISQVGTRGDDGEMGLGLHPGLIDSAASLPALIGQHAPQWAKNAAERDNLNHESARNYVGLPEPHGFAQNFAEAGGTMLGQLPLPSTRLRELLQGLRKVPVAGKMMAATAPVAEWLGPTVDPTMHNYTTGALVGGGLGTLGDMGREQENPLAVGPGHAKGGKVNALMEMLRAMSFNPIPGGKAHLLGDPLEDAKYASYEAMQQGKQSPEDHAAMSALLSQYAGNHPDVSDEDLTSSMLALHSRMFPGAENIRETPLNVTAPIGSEGPPIAVGKRKDFSHWGFADGGQVGQTGSKGSMDWYNTYGMGPENQWYTPPAYDTGMTMGSDPQLAAPPPAQDDAGASMSLQDLAKTVKQGKKLYNQYQPGVNTGLGGTQGALDNMGKNLSLPGAGGLSAASNLFSPTQGALNSFGSSLAVPGQSLAPATNIMNPGTSGFASNLNLGSAGLGGTSAALGSGVTGGFNAGSGLFNYDFSGVAAPQMAGGAASGLSNLSKVLGPAGAALATYNAIKNYNSGDYGGNTARMAAAGATIGSIVPGIGTLIGGLVGGGVGLVSSAFGPGKKTMAEGYWDEFKKDPKVNGAQIADKDLQHIWGGGWTSNKKFLQPLDSALASKYGKAGEDGQMWNYQQFINDTLADAQKSGKDVTTMNRDQLMGLVNGATTKLTGGKSNPVMDTNFKDAVGAFTEKAAASLNHPGTGIYSELHDKVYGPSPPPATTPGLQQLIAGGARMPGGLGVNMGAIQQAVAAANAKKAVPVAPNRNLAQNVGGLAHAV